MNTENTTQRDLAWLGRELDTRLQIAEVDLAHAKETEDESGDAIDSIERGWHEGYVKALNDVRQLSHDVSEKDCSQCWYYGYASRTTDELLRVTTLVRDILNITKLEGMNKNDPTQVGNLFENTAFTGGDVLDAIVEVCRRAGFQQTDGLYQP